MRVSGSKSNSLASYLCGPGLVIYIPLYSPPNLRMQFLKFYLLESYALLCTFTLEI